MKKIITITMAAMIGILLAFGASTAQAVGGESRVGTNTRSGVTFVENNNTDTSTTDSSSTDSSSSSSGDHSGTGNHSGGTGNGSATGTGGKTFFPQTGEIKNSLYALIGTLVIAGTILVLWRRKKAQAK